MASQQLKPCTLSDLALLRRISQETFTGAFGSQNNPADLQDYLHQAFSEEQLENELRNPESRFFFLFWKGQLAGYVKLNQGQAQTDLRDPDALEIERIYVRGAFQGQGLGSWLLRQLKSLAEREGKGYLWLGVWEENRDAIRFYERHGFITFGKHPYYIGSDRQMDWMMRLELPSAK